MILGKFVPTTDDKFPIFPLSAIGAGGPGAYQFASDNYPFRFHFSCHDSNSDGRIR